MVGKSWRILVSFVALVVFGMSWSCLPLRAADEYVLEPSKKIPVAYDVDVVVAGGGIAGTIASITAARHGAKTLVIDRLGRFGGNMGPGMFAGGSTHFALQAAGDDGGTPLVNRIGLGGVPEEILRRIIFSRPDADQITEEMRKELERTHMNTPGLRVGGRGRLPGYLVDSHGTSYVAFQMMEEAGVEMLLSAYVADPIMEGSKVKGVFVETKSGRLAVRAKVVIDATGEGDVAFRAGAPMLHLTDPKCGVCFAIKGVDWGKYRGQKPEEADGFHYVREIPGYPEANITILMKPPSQDDICFGRTGTKTIDVGDAKQVTLMEREHRKHVFEYAAFMRKHAPGFENAYLLMVAPYLGSRGGRTIESVRRVGGADVQAHQKFDDVIYIYYHDKSPDYCDVPYRIMLPKKIDGLLAAGRSGIVRGPNLRQRYSVMLNAQAAGIAAALCAAQGIEPRNLDVKQLQKELVKVGCPLGDEERIKELGLE